MTTPDKDIRFTVTAEDRFAQTFARLKKDIAGGGEQLDRFTTLASKASSAVSLLAFGGAAAGLGLTGAVRQLAKDLDALNDASDALGDSVENLSALENVARRNGEGLDLVVTAVNKLNKALGEAKPQSPMALALERIGLNAKDLRQLDPSEALQRVAIALQDYGNSGEKARIIQELFGKSSREVAAFLKDLAEAGKLNATVTAAQAEEAERFNKQLAELTTNAGNAARTVAGQLVSAINQLFAAVNGGGVGGANPIEDKFVIPMQALSVLGANVAFTFKGVGKEVGGVAAQLTALARGDFSGAAEIGRQMKDDAKAAREDFDALERRLLNIGRVLPQASYSNEGLNRGGKLKTLPSPPEPGGEKKISEAERYLEKLQKEGEKLQELSTVQQLLADIENKRIDGITPKLRTKLFLEAASVDTQKRISAELKAQQEELDALIAKTERRSSKLESLLNGTPTGRAQEAERNVEVLLNVARANPEDEALQRQVLEAVKQQRKAFDDATVATGEQTKELDKLTVVVDRFAEQSVDALVDFAMGAEDASSRLAKAFERDLLRALIEDPVRDAMKNTVKIIRDELGKLNSEDNPLAKFFSSLGSGGGGSGGEGGTDWIGTIMKLFGGGGTTRAGGGGVRAGQLVRWQENGREWFVPQEDGAVIRQDQMTAGGESSGSHTFNIYDAKDPRETARQVAAVLDARDARKSRGARFGRMAGAGG